MQIFPAHVAIKDILFFK